MMQHNLHFYVIQLQDVRTTGFNVYVAHLCTCTLPYAWLLQHAATLIRKNVITRLDMLPNARTLQLSRPGLLRD
jgi:hypothetical protein